MNNFKKWTERGRFLLLALMTWKCTLHSLQEGLLTPAPSGDLWISLSLKYKKYRLRFQILDFLWERV